MEQETGKEAVITLKIEVVSEGEGVFSPELLEELFGDTLEEDKDETIEVQEDDEGALVDETTETEKETEASEEQQPIEQEEEDLEESDEKQATMSPAARIANIKEID